MKDFRNLKVWEKAHHLALALYQITASFPREETYGLASQIRRGASSIPSNIAEGCGREGDSELARFCIIARGSASELEYQLLLARDLKIIQPTDYDTLSEQTVEIKRMLTVLIQKLTAKCHSLPAISCFCLPIPRSVLYLSPNFSLPVRFLLRVNLTIRSTEMETGLAEAVENAILRSDHDPAGSNGW
jgi:four helix bundle protein